MVEWEWRIRPWLEVHIKGDIRGTEEMGGGPWYWPFLVTLEMFQIGSFCLQKVQLSKEQRGGSLRCFGYATCDFALCISLSLCGCFSDFKTFLLFLSFCYCCCPVQLSLKESVIPFVGCTAQDGSVKQVRKRKILSLYPGWVLWPPVKMTAWVSSFNSKLKYQ